MHLEYIVYLIVPDQIQSDCKARAEIPTAQSTNSTKTPLFYTPEWLQVLIYSIPRLGFTLCCFQYRCSISDQLGSLSWPVFGLQKKVVKFLEKYFGGLVCSGMMAGSPPQQLLLSASKEDQARKTHRKREGVQGLFLCFSGHWCSFRSVCGPICPSLAAALFLLGCLGYLFCFIFQFIFTNFEQPGRKESKLAAYFPHILYSCAVCLAKPRYKRLSRAERTQDPSSSM